MEFSWEILSLLFLVALFAGFIDSIAGGGGLITIPTLLSLGLSPAIALGTNKLQACGGSFAASLYFIRKKIVSPKQIWLFILLTFIGAALGTISVQILETEILNAILPFLILCIALYFLFSPRLKDEDSRQRINDSTFAFGIAFSIGFYDGLFGPATGSFFTLAFLLLLGYNLTKSVAHAKVLNFTSNLASLLFFILGGAIIWKIGLIMMAGQLIGGSLGAKMVVTKGKKIIRPLIVTISLLMTAKMFFQQGYFSF
ncbi:hypothetical protein EV693_10784 [Nicoletella semolina]|uniref:Probable membrane transporter protein n=1 Tax=Nicoletella semolina TaxID=271160 RepID=A0A4R2N8E8_9PAST|nr:TSUP family transporter [Nicoletella semolina]MDH2923904.1 hypothetical protein [Nicoletella semolina]TCP17219.1 hypothetical protein EV693_10784 [Nicoletella semolina]